MYEVYSQTRPGRPRWAMAACALLLLLTVVLAAVLSASKARGTRVTLTHEPELFPAGHLRVRMPVDWSRDKTRLSDLPGIVAEAHGVSGGLAIRDHPTGEMVLVFRGSPSRNGIPSVDAAESIAELVGETEGLVRGRSEPAQMGALPAWQSEYSSDPRQRRAEQSYVISRSALAPDGQIAGILFTCPRPPSVEDRRMFDGMCASLEFSDLRIADKPEATMKEAGIVFAPPAGTRFFVSASDQPLPVPRVRLVGGEGRSTWYLEAARVPLLDSRKTTQLVEMRARAFIKRLALPATIQTGQIGGHPITHLTVTLDGNTAPTVLLWGADIDEQTGLMIVGRYETDGEAPLRTAAEAITAGTIATFKTVLDLPEAQANARRCLQEIAAEGLSKKWSDQSIVSFLTQSPRIPTLKEMRTYQVIPDQGGAKWWGITVGYASASPNRRLKLNMREEWRIRDDTTSHGGVVRVVRGRRDGFEYRERRLAGVKEVLCTLAINDEEPAGWTVPADDTYVSDPVLAVAGAKLALDPKARPAVFSASENFCSQAVHWIMMPIGERPLPGAEPGKSVPAVCLTTDYDPAPLIFYYDRDGAMLATALDNGMWQERMPTETDAEPEPTQR